MFTKEFPTWVLLLTITITITSTITITITIIMCLHKIFQPECSYLRSYFAHGTPQPRTCRGLQKIVPAPFVLNCDFAKKNVPASFFSIVPQIMSMAPGWMSCPWRSWTWRRNWVSLVVNFDHPGCHHKWNHWISSISWPAQEIESRESTVGSSVGWRCNAGTEARWPRHLDWQNFV